MKTKLMPTKVPKKKIMIRTKENTVAVAASFPSLLSEMISEVMVNNNSVSRTNTKIPLHSGNPAPYTRISDKRIHAITIYIYTFCDHLP